MIIFDGKLYSLLVGDRHKNTQPLVGCHAHEEGALVGETCDVVARAASMSRILKQARCDAVRRYTSNLHP